MQWQARTHRHTVTTLYLSNDKAASREIKERNPITYFEITIQNPLVLNTGARSIRVLFMEEKKKDLPYQESRLSVHTKSSANLLIKIS